MTGLAAKTFAVPVPVPVPVPEAVAAGAPIPAVATIDKQLKTEWCWAAVITSIVATRQNPPSHYVRQCDLAYDTLQQVFNGLTQDGCCDELSPIGNKALSANWMNGQFGQAKSPLTLAGLAGSSPRFFVKSIPSEGILQALRDGKAVCVGITWQSGRSHFIAIVGARMEGNVQLFAVGDPTHGTVCWLSHADIESYQTADGKGTWEYTYVTL